MPPIIEQCMIFAAGYGKRLKPLTDHIPKPLIPIGDTTCLDESIRKIKGAGVKRIVVNTHHLAEQIHKHLENYPSIVISNELEILETGGGLVKALPHFDQNKPILIVNGDIWWKDGPVPMLSCLFKVWDSKRMDILLLMMPKEIAIGYFGKGDYFLKSDGRLEYRSTHDCAPYVYAGVMIMNPLMIKNDLPKNFSIKLLFDQAENDGRLFGHTHDNLWGDIGSPKGLEDVRKEISL